MTTLARYQSFALDDAGNVLASPTVEVRNEATSALAPLFSDRAGASGMTNTFTGGSDGLIAFHVAGGAYKITVTKGAVTRIFRYVAIGTAAEADAIDPTAIAVSANKLVDQTGVTSAAFTQITFPNELYDIGGYYSSNAWTPKAGKVAISVIFLASGTIAANALCSVSIYKNAVAFKSIAVGAIANNAGCCLSIEDIATGSDSYTAFGYVTTSSGTATFVASQGCAFMGHWIGP